MPLDACRPVYFYTHTPVNVPPCLWVCIAVAAPQTLFQWMCCLCVLLHVCAWAGAHTWALGTRVECDCEWETGFF